MKKHLLIILSSAFILNSYSQTISESDLAPEFGSTLNQLSGPDFGEIVIDEGAGQTFDFQDTGVGFTNSFSATISDPADTEFQANFPTAAFGEEDIDGDISFYGFDNNLYSILGYGYPGESAELELVSICELPITLGGNLPEAELNEEDDEKSTFNSSTIAAGTLLLPDGVSYENCLVVKFDVEFSSLEKGIWTVDESIGIYFFFSAGYSLPVCTIFNFYDGGAYTNSSIEYLESSVVSINSITAENNFTVYPNPTNDQVTISGSAAGDEVSITDMTGKTVWAEVLTSNQTSVDVSPFSQGIYSVRLKSNGTFKTEKLVISK